MRNLWLLAVVMAMAAAVAQAAEKNAKADSGGANGEFTENLAAATKLAKESNKLILLDFTGSDWCPWCAKLKEQVFDTAEFKKWAAENVVLVEVDQPEKRALAKGVKEQNDKLKEKYQPHGTPTVVFINAEGTEVGRVDGFRMAAEQWMKQAKAVVGR